MKKRVKPYTRYGHTESVRLIYTKKDGSEHFKDFATYWGAKGYVDEQEDAWSDWVILGEGGRVLGSIGEADRSVEKATSFIAYDIVFEDPTGYRWFMSIASRAPNIYGHAIEEGWIFPSDPRKGRIRDALAAAGGVGMDVRRLRRLKTSGDPGRSEYRGFRIESFEGVSARPPTYASLGRGEMTGGFRKEKGFLIHLPDGGTKFVPTMKRAKEYIDNYLGTGP